MPVRAEALGRELPPSTAEVTARWTLAYAAAIGDLGERTFDDAGEAPLVAPPSFCVRLEWAVIRQRAGLLGVDEAESRRVVHAEQDSVFHRPIRPGDVLVTRGRVVGIRHTRAGSLVQTRLSTADARTEAEVVTSWHSALYRGVGVAGGEGQVESPPPVPDPPAAALLRSREIPIPRPAAHVYTECSGIWNPIHTERRAALAAGLPDIVAHGTMTWAMAGREMVSAYAGGDPTRLRRLRARFRALVVPGQPLVLRHGPGASGHAHFQAANAHGQAALEGGFAEVGG